MSILRDYTEGFVELFAVCDFLLNGFCKARARNLIFEVQLGRVPSENLSDQRQAFVFANLVEHIAEANYSAFLGENFL